MACECDIIGLPNFASVLRKQNKNKDLCRN